MNYMRFYLFFIFYKIFWTSLTFQKINKKRQSYFADRKSKRSKTEDLESNYLYESDIRQNKYLNVDDRCLVLETSKKCKKCGIYSKLKCWIKKKKNLQRSCDLEIRNGYNDRCDPNKRNIILYMYKRIKNGLHSSQYVEELSSSFKKFDLKPEIKTDDKDNYIKDPKEIDRIYTVDDPKFKRRITIDRISSHININYQDCGELILTLLLYLDKIYLRTGGISIRSGKLKIFIYKYRIKFIADLHSYDDLKATYDIFDEFDVKREHLNKKNDFQQVSKHSDSSESNKNNEINMKKSISMSYKSNYVDNNIHPKNLCKNMKQEDAVDDIKINDEDHQKNCCSTKWFSNSISYGFETTKASR